MAAELERLEQKLRALRGQACAEKFRRINRQLLDVDFRPRKNTWKKLKAVHTLQNKAMQALQVMRP